MAPNLIVGSDGGQNLSGTAAADLIYGFDPFDPNGSQASPTSIAAARVAVSLLQPVYVTAPPDDPNRLFVVEKTGRIKIVDISAADLGTYSVRATPFLNLSAEIDSFGERGLLGLVFDPGFAQNGYFYVNLINPAGDTELRRYRASASDPDQADPASAQLIITIGQPSASNHKAGWLGFGPDGFLYAALGDGGNTPSASQDINSLRGKILRLDVHADAFPADPARNYAIPAGNPFVGVAGADEIFALGLRNPWRDSFDRATGELFIADVGSGAWEEVDLGAPGANYGWPTAEGPNGQMPGFTAPIFSYPHVGGQSITGGYVYRGQSDFLHGQYFYADFIDSFVATLLNTGGTWSSTDRTAQILPTAGAVGSPASFGEDARGDLYIVDIGGEVFRLTPGGTSGDGADIIAGGDGADQVFAGAGDDQVTGEAGDDVLLGMDGDDTLGGGVGLDRLDGGAGADALSGGSEADWLHGGALADLLNGGMDDDRLFGGTGGDQLIGGPGDDTSAGGLGDDWHFVDSAGDRVIDLVGEGAADRVFARSSFTLTDGAEIEIFSTDNHAGVGAINLTGNARGNLIYGNAGANTLNGGGGVDRLIGFGGDDFFFIDNASDTVVEAAGGGANDRVFTSVSYTLAAGLQVEILSTTNSVGLAAINLTGNEFANGIAANAGGNVVNGKGGNDVLFGLAGGDAFVFDTALHPNANVDRLPDFDVAADTIQLARSVFTTLAPGPLAASAFHTGAAAADGDDRIIYNSANGVLSYDENGSAGGGATQFATLPAGLALSAADFVVV